MIKPNELRIGNWIYSEKNIGYDPAGFIKVRSTHPDGINEWKDMGASGVGKYSDLDGILLTPEILKKCGIIMGSRIEFWIESLDITKSIYFDGSFNGGIKYLHQLQNIMVDLAGELNIEFL